jgi:hypothetical protein
MLKEMSTVDSPHMMILRSEIKTVTTDDAWQEGSVRYWKTPRKETTALKKFKGKENINLVGCDTVVA